MEYNNFSLIKVNWLDACIALKEGLRCIGFFRPALAVILSSSGRCAKNKRSEGQNNGRGTNFQKEKDCTFKQCSGTGTATFFPGGTGTVIQSTSGSGFRSGSNMDKLLI